MWRSGSEGSSVRGIMRPRSDRQMRPSEFATQLAEFRSPLRPAGITTRTRKNGSRPLRRGHDAGQPATTSVGAGTLCCWESKQESESAASHTNDMTYVIVLQAITRSITDSKALFSVQSPCSQNGQGGQEFTTLGRIHIHQLP